jgi:Histidine kinase-, DNA gyrase B-, and HSP90-like ATPase
MAPRLARTAEGSRPDPVFPDNVRIGKDLIELITSGMYVFPVTIYREYIQNAADAIDVARAQGLIGSDERGRVSIEIDHTERSVAIRDDGGGIPVADALQTLLAIGGSAKRGTGARGFRGVGRLSGLAYCQELEFRTKAAYDTSVLSLTIDCKLLRSRLGDPSFSGDVRKVISESTYIWNEKCDDPREHFFEVRLRDVGRHRQDMLLNEKLIGQYLAQVAPVPFSEDFSYATRIEEHLARFMKRVPVELTIGENRVVRPYQDEIRVPGGPYRLKIDEIEFIEFANVDGEVGGVGWLAHHDYVRSIHPSLAVRGLRVRVGDLQVGEPDLLDDCFKEARFNAWTMGEIHVLDRRIVPNARRDNFELNHHTYNLTTQIGPVAAQITRRCRSASVARNSAIIIRHAIEQIEERLADERPLAAGELSRFRASILRCQGKLKGVDDTERELLRAGLSRLDEQLAALRPSEEGSVVSLDETLLLITKYVTNREQADRLADALKKICG